MTAEKDQIEIRLSRALAAGAVLRGYVQHQRERLGEQAATNPNFQNVSSALQALEEYVGPLADSPRGTDSAQRAGRAGESRRP